MTETTATEIYNLVHKTTALTAAEIAKIKPFLDSEYIRKIALQYAIKEPFTIEDIRALWLSIGVNFTSELGQDLNIKDIDAFLLNFYPDNAALLEKINPKKYSRGFRLEHRVFSKISSLPDFIQDEIEEASKYETNINKEFAADQFNFHVLADLAIPSGTILPLLTNNNEPELHQFHPVYGYENNKGLAAAIFTPYNIPENSIPELKMCFRGTKGGSSAVLDTDPFGPGNTIMYRKKEFFLASINKKIKEYLALTGKDKIDFSCGGHSLGGSLSQLMLYYLLEEIANKDSPYKELKKISNLKLTTQNSPGISKTIVKRMPSLLNEVKITTPNLTIQYNCNKTEGDGIQQAGWANIFAEVEPSQATINLVKIDLSTGRLQPNKNHRTKAFSKKAIEPFDNVFKNFSYNQNPTDNALIKNDFTHHIRKAFIFQVILFAIVFYILNPIRRLWHSKASSKASEIPIKTASPATNLPPKSEAPSKTVSLQSPTAENTPKAELEISLNDTLAKRAYIKRKNIPYRKIKLNKKTEPAIFKKSYRTGKNSYLYGKNKLLATTETDKTSIKANFTSGNTNETAKLITFDIISALRKKQRLTNATPLTLAINKNPNRALTDKDLEIISGIKKATDELTDINFILVGFSEAENLKIKEKTQSTTDTFKHGRYSDTKIDNSELSPLIKPKPQP